MSAAPGPFTPKPDPAASSQTAVPNLPTAWQPLTPRGVAAFARATSRRLFLLQLLVALLAGGAFVWFLHAACLPALQKAVAQLPDEGQVQRQTLSTPLRVTTTLAAEPVLGMVVDLPRLGRPNLPSDIIVVFHETDLEVCTPFGSLVFRYPKGWTIEFNRKELAPAVPAWAPFVLAVAGLLTAALLLLIWTLLASILFPVPLLVARYSDRALRFSESWKLTSAALLPGTLLLSFALVIYERAWINLVQLALLAAAHLMVGWLYLVLSPLALPRAAESEPVPAQNPFVPAPPLQPTPGAQPPAPERQKNPFAPSTHSSAPQPPPTGSSEPWET